MDRLKAQWRALYNSAPSQRLARGLLIGAVAYGLQEKLWADSRLPPATAC